MAIREYRIRGTLTLELPRTVKGEEMTPEGAQDMAIIEALADPTVIHEDVVVEET